MKLKSVIGALFVTLGTSGMALHADSVNATATKVDGNVYVTDASGKSNKIETGDKIAVGSLIHTNAHSSVLLKLVPGAITIVSPGTDVVITTLEYSQTATGAKVRKIKLNLKAGELVCSLAKHDGHSDFRIVTPMGTTKAVGTDWSVTFSASAGVTVETVDGVVQITLPNGKVVDVPGGQVTTSPDGVTTVTGPLSKGQINEITQALGGAPGSGGGGTFSITPVNQESSNPANTTSNETVSPNE